MEIQITRPDDWHIHLRDGDVLKTTVNHAARTFRRAIVMPNLVPPVTTPIWLWPIVSASWRPWSPGGPSSP